MDKPSVFFTILFSLFLGCQSLNAQTTTMYNEEKLSLGVGLGVQYSLVGVQGKYFFTDYLAAAASGTYSQYGALWNVGVELRVPEILPRRVSPYFNVFVGTNTYASLEAFVSTGGMFGGFFEIISEKDAFIGLTIGSGIKWDVFNNNSGYLKLGMDYRFIPSAFVEFVDRFNGTYATTYSTDPIGFLPSIGYVFCLSRKSK